MKTTAALPLRIDVVPFLRMPSTQRGVFTYGVPDTLAPRCTRGAFVLVPFRRRRVWGIVLHSPSRERTVDTTSLRAVFDVRRDCALTEEEVLEIEQTASLYRTSLPTTAYLALPIPPLSGRPKPGFTERPKPGFGRTAEGGLPALLSHLGTTLAVFHTHQQRLATIRSVAEDIVRTGRSLLILTPHRVWCTRIQRTLQGLTVVLLDRTAGRHAAWGQTVAARNPSIVILGTRAAAFTAPPSLGAIVIDLAESDDHKQYDMEPRYDGRDVTARIAAARRIPRLLLTAAPRAVDWAGDVRRVDLGAPVDAHWTLVNLHDHWRGGGRGLLTDALVSAIERCRAAGRVAVVLHNRRGRMARITCRDCGKTIECPRCHSPLTEHADGLACRYCSKHSPPPSSCPSCQSPHLVGHGIGTVGVVDTLLRLCSDVRISRIDRESAPLPPPDAEIIVASERFTTSIAPIFQRPVGLIAVLHAERYARGDDYRADERLVQALRNVYVWAQTWGVELLVQTSAPNWRHWRALPLNLPDFYRADLEERRALGYPPATRLIRLDLRGTDAGAAARIIHLIESQKFATLRSVEGPISSARGQHARVSIVLRLDPTATDQDIAVITAVVPPEWSVDVDPIDL